MAHNWPTVDKYPHKIDTVLYHGPNCPDGFGAAFSAWKVLGNQASYVSCVHGDTPPNIEGKHVIVFDFAFSRPVTLQLKQAAASFILFDHHKSAMEDLQGEANCFFDLHKSGARLAWEFFHPSNEVPQLISYVEDKDLWNWRLENSKEFNTAMDTTPFSFEEWDTLLSAEKVIMHIQKGRTLTAYKNKLCEDIASKAQQREWLGKTIYVVNSSLFASEIGNILSSRADCHFAVVWNFNHEKKYYAVSLRSNAAKNIDVSVVAKLFGGGGHPCSSGFSWTGANIEDLFTKQ